MPILAAFLASILEGVAQAPLDLSATLNASEQPVIECLGYPTLDHIVERSVDMHTWTPVTNYQTGDGLFTALDAEPLLQGRRFFRLRPVPIPATIAYAGSAVVLVRQGFSPGARVHFNLDGDGTFEQTVTADANGLISVVLDTTALADDVTVEYFTENADGSGASAVMDLTLNRTGSLNLAHAVPTNLATPPPIQSPVPQQALLSPPPEPGICACEDCGSDIFESFTSSYTPTDNFLELATGKLRQNFLVSSFPTRLIDFNLRFHHTSLTQYNGTFGQGFSHGMQMMIVRRTPFTADIITPDLRVFQTASEDGINWFSPEGFFSRLQYDGTLKRWTLTHFSGARIQFFDGLVGRPGLPIAAREPNGNQMTLGYDTNGRLNYVSTPLGQVQQFQYGSDQRLDSYTDHLSRTWDFSHDAQGRLTQIAAPETTNVDTAAADLVDDETLPEFLASGRRTTQLAYNDENFPNQITDFFDGRGETPRRWDYDNSGRVQTAYLNNLAKEYDYAPSDPPVLPLLGCWEPSHSSHRPRG